MIALLNDILWLRCIPLHRWHDLLEEWHSSRFRWTCKVNRHFDAKSPVQWLRLNLNLMSHEVGYLRKKSPWAELISSTPSLIWAFQPFLDLVDLPVEILNFLIFVFALSFCSILLFLDLIRGDSVDCLNVLWQDPLEHDVFLDDIFWGCYCWKVRYELLIVSDCQVRNDFFWRLQEWRFDTSNEVGWSTRGTLCAHWGTIQHLCFRTSVCVSARTGQQLKIAGVNNTEDAWAFWAGSYTSRSNLRLLKSWMPVKLRGCPGTWGPGTLGPELWARELWARELANWIGPGTFGHSEWQERRRAPSFGVCQGLERPACSRPPHGNFKGPALAVGRWAWEVCRAVGASSREPTASTGNTSFRDNRWPSFSPLHPQPPRSSHESDCCDLVLVPQCRGSTGLWQV